MSLITVTSVIKLGNDMVPLAVVAAVAVANNAMPLSATAAATAAAVTVAKRTDNLRPSALRPRTLGAVDWVLRDFVSHHPRAVVLGAINVIE